MKTWPNHFRIKMDLTIRQRWKIHMRKNFWMLNGSLALVIYVEWNEMKIAPKIKGKITISTLYSGDGYIYRIFEALYTFCVGELKLPSFNIIDAPPFSFRFVLPMNERSWLAVDCYFVLLLYFSLHIVWWCLSLMCTLYTLQIQYSIEWTRWLDAVIQCCSYLS